MRKHLLIFGVLFLFAFFYFFIDFENSVEAQFVLSCPIPKDFSVTAAGSGMEAQGVPASILIPLPIIIMSSVEAEAMATKKAINDCNRQLGKKIVQANKDCENYCRTVPFCSSIISVDGPNSCNGKIAKCTSTSQSLADWVNIANQFSPPLNLNANVDVAVCVVTAKTTVQCNCEEI